MNKVIYIGNGNTLKGNFTKNNEYFVLEECSNGFVIVRDNHNEPADISPENYIRCEETCDE